ncbi:thermonuclease family protein, partial [Brucella intermedia]|uniref:thermonuclease family protein n=2 Tax=Brucella intermedia TaxID=94625 RepID=UPI0022487832
MKLASYLNDAQPIVCAQRDTDQYGRIVATCENIYGQDLARWLVRNGHALDWPQFSKGAYADVQKDAQSRKAGIWQGRFMECQANRRIAPLAALRNCPPSLFSGFVGFERRSGLLQKTGPALF